jgi:general secretion pathway protein F
VARFRFEAVDAAGRIERGVSEGAGARALRDALRAQGLTPLAVEELAGSERASAAQPRIRLEDLAMLTRQLATLVNAGTPIDRALLAVAEQSERAAVAATLQAIHAEVVSGRSLAAALGPFPRTFDELYRGLVAAGLETGQLGPVLARLADYLESRRALRQKVVGALIYPALVTLIAAAVVAALLFYVIPQVVAVYQQSRQTLPLLTRALIGFTAFARDSGVYWAFGSALAVAAAVFAMRLPAWREAVHRLAIRLPVAGRLAVAIDTARFASTLAILTRSRTPLLRAIEYAAQVVRLLPLRHAALGSIDRVRSGAPLARALGETRIFPPLLVHLVANGEASGALPEMLDRAGEEMRLEVERRLAWLTALLEPALIVLMGGVVLVLVLAVMLPIVSMNQLLR